MSERVTIKGLDKGAVIAALYNNAKSVGLGLLHYTPEPMTPETGAKFIDEYLDYLQGRVMKVEIKSDADDFDPWLYDRDNGNGAAQRAVDSIR